MKIPQLFLSLLIAGASWGQPIPKTTPFTRYFLASTNSADAQTRLQVLTPSNSVLAAYLMARTNGAFPNAFTLRGGTNVVLDTNEFPYIDINATGSGDGGTNTPTASEKEALVGTAGTPASTNKFVTDADARNTNSRPPSAHTHPSGEVTGLGALATKSTVANADVAGGAAIAESKLSLNYATHSPAYDPSAGEKAALAGTTGTPGAGNKFVTDSDTRLLPSGNLPSSSEKAALAGTAGTPASTNKFVTDADSRLLGGANSPTSGEKAALAGTSGTPGSGNKYVTDADSRLVELSKNASIFVDPVNGSDGTGTRGKQGKPFLTLAAGLAVMQSGDVLVALPGRHTITPGYGTGAGPSQAPLQIRDRTNVALLGYGAEIYGAGAGDFLCISNVQNFRISGFRFQGTRPEVADVANPLFAMITLRQGTAGGEIDNCTFDGFGDHAISTLWVDQTTVSSIRIRNSRFSNGGDPWVPAMADLDGAGISSVGPFWKISGNAFSNVVRGVEFWNTGTGTIPGVEVSGNSFDHVYDAAVLVLSGSVGSGETVDLSIVGNTFRDFYAGGPTYGEAIKIVRASRISITGNQIVGVQKYGVNLLTDATGRVSDASIVGNQISYSGNAAISVADVTLRGMSNILVAVNSIFQVNDTGAITVSHGRSVRVDGNRIANGSVTITNGAGILINGTNSIDVAVANNTVSASPWGIKIETGVVGAQLWGNTGTGLSLGLVSDQGSSTERFDLSVGSTGTGDFVRKVTPIIVSPILAGPIVLSNDWTTLSHTHLDGPSGSQLPGEAIGSGTVSNARLPTNIVANQITASTGLFTGNLTVSTGTNGPNASSTPLVLYGATTNEWVGLQVVSGGSTNGTNVAIWGKTLEERLSMKVKAEMNSDGTSDTIEYAFRRPDKGAVALVDSYSTRSKTNHFFGISGDAVYLFASAKAGEVMKTRGLVQWSFEDVGSAPASFGIANSSTYTGGGATSFTNSFNNSATYSNCVVLKLAYYSSIYSLTEVSYGGSAMTLLGTTNDGSNIRSSIYYLVGAPTGVNNLIVTSGSSIAEYAAVVSGWNKVHQGTPWGTPVVAIGNDTTPTATVSSATGEIVVGMVGSFNRTLTLGAGQTLIGFADGAPGTTDSTGSYEDGSTSVTHSYTAGVSGTWGLVAGSLKPSP